MAALVLSLVLGLQLATPPATSIPPERSAPAPDRPNVVLVIMDDFSLELLSTMRAGQQMRRDGAEFVNAFVVDSLCCPSRAATLTGLPPHLNGVRTNTAAGPGRPQGGYRAFRRHGDQAHTVNVALHRSGYRTGFVGKFMNEYEPVGGRLPLVPGWDDFEAVVSGGYREWDFDRTTREGDRLVLHHVPRPPAAASRERKDRGYATNVIARRTLRLVHDYEAGDRPYFLYVAPYGPHARVGGPAWPGDSHYPAALRDRPRPGQPNGSCGPRRCRSLTVRDLPGFGDSPRDNAPTYVTPGSASRPAASWRRSSHPMGRARAERLLRDRARMVQSIDRMVARLRSAVGPDTYLVLTSDNGFHLGQHGLAGGKGTPYDSDVHVPLLVTGPGVVPGPRPVVTTNLDLAPTIEALAGAPASGARAGTSLVPSLRDPGASRASYAFVEHTHGPVVPGEPDADAGTGGRLDAIPSYVAVRSTRGLLVRLDMDQSWRGTRYAWELYDYRRLSWERRNVYATHRDDPWVRDLRRRLLAWVDCAPSTCRELTR